MDLKILGEFIHYERERQNMTIGQVCERAHISNATYWRIRKGNGIQADSLFSIMESLGHDMVSFGKGYEQYGKQLKKWCGW